MHSDAMWPCFRTRNRVNTLRRVFSLCKLDAPDRGDDKTSVRRFLPNSCFTFLKLLRTDCISRILASVCLFPSSRFCCFGSDISRSHVLILARRSQESFFAFLLDNRLVHLRVSLNPLLSVAVNAARAVN